MSTLPPAPMPGARILAILVGFPAASTAISLLLLSPGVFASTGLDFFTVFWSIITGWYSLQIFILWRVLKVSGWRWRDIGYPLDARRTLYLIAGYLAFALAMLGFVEYVLANSDIDPARLASLSDLSNLTPRTTTDRFIFVLMGLVAGLCEELVYRGFAIRALASRGWNPWLAGLAATIPFVFQHGLKSLDQFGWFFGWGIAFGAIFILSKRLQVTITIHWLVILSAMLGVLEALK